MRSRFFQFFTHLGEDVVNVLLKYFEDDRFRRFFDRSLTVVGTLLLTSTLLLSTVSSGRGIPTPKTNPHEFILVLGVLVGSGLGVIITSGVAKGLLRGPTGAAKVKLEITKAFHYGLDSSKLNPAKAGGYRK